MATRRSGYCGFIFHWTGWAVNWEWWGEAKWGWGWPKQELSNLFGSDLWLPKADLRCAQQRPTFPERLISVNSNAQLVTVGLAWTNLIRHSMHRVAVWGERRMLFEVLMKGICLVSVNWRLITVGTVENEGCTGCRVVVNGRRRCSYTCVTFIYAGKSLTTTEEASWFTFKLCTIILFLFSSVA